MMIIPKNLPCCFLKAQQTFTDNSCSKDLWVLGTQNMKDDHLRLILILPSLGFFGQPSFYTRKRSILYSSSSLLIFQTSNTMSLPCLRSSFWQTEEYVYTIRSSFLPLIISAAHLHAFSLFCFLPFLGLLKLI